MISSMTGFAAASEHTARGALNLEVRSVNSRFLDVQIRTGDELRAFEPLLREAVNARIARGKVDCRLYAGEEPAAPAAERLDAAAVARLQSLAAQAKAAFPDARPLGVADVLRWPGVVAQPA